MISRLCNNYEADMSDHPLRQSSPSKPSKQDQQQEGKTAEPSSSTKNSFPWKLFRLLEDAAVDESKAEIISWLPDGRGFKVHKPAEFVKHLLVRYFKTQTKLKSFTRQLYIYGFSKVPSGANVGAFFHPLFVRGNEEAMLRLKRNKCHDRRFKRSSAQNEAIAGLSKSPSGASSVSSQGSMEDDDAKRESLVLPSHNSILNASASASASPLLSSGAAAGRAGRNIGASGVNSRDNLMMMMEPLHAENASAPSFWLDGALDMKNSIQQQPSLPLSQQGDDPYATRSSIPSNFFVPGAAAAATAQLFGNQTNRTTSSSSSPIPQPAGSRRSGSDSNISPTTTNTGASMQLVQFSGGSSLSEAGLLMRRQHQNTEEGKEATLFLGGRETGRTASLLGGTTRNPFDISSSISRASGGGNTRTASGDDSSLQWDASIFEPRSIEEMKRNP